MFDSISPPLELQNQRVDLRVAKTHRLVRQALLQLLATHEYSEIRVEDILQEALVNRATFYKYYSCKDDLVGKMIAAVKHNINQIIDKRIQYANLNEFLDHYLPALYALRYEILSLWKVNTPRHHLRKDMIKMVEARFKYLSQLAFPKQKEEDLNLQAYMFSHLAIDVMEYLLKQNTLPALHNIPQHLEQIIVMMQCNFNEIPTTKI
ncbi:TetR/AcrR family transcriptional regulator [Psittacicella gerlachiana]|uniref:HTH tetR-type domain-containing protein n=1 Tax=Psittacicella gerlachiana TaxID=2028574 RepID=A0A3A1YDY9_9GAMM|nr:TetR/AcrR family transcriptional regulator [Psittacicella gerlachiana]RIY34347.1 hypothetical protein CKF59_05615 [Psittacicella gerlachiana]